MEYVIGCANILANYYSYAPVEALGGLMDETAFNLSQEILSSVNIYAGLKEHCEDFIESLRDQ